MKALLQTMKKNIYKFNLLRTPLCSLKHLQIQFAWNSAWESIFQQTLILQWSESFKKYKNKHSLKLVFDDDKGLSCTIIT